MKISNVKIYNLFSDNYTDSGVIAFNKLCNANLNASASYKRMRNIKTLQIIFKDILEMRDSIILKYGKTRDDGEVSIEKDDIENIANFNREFNEILSMEDDIKIEKLSFDDLNGHIEMTEAEFESLIFMIELPENNEPEEQVKTKKRQKVKSKTSSKVTKKKEEI